MRVAGQPEDRLTRARRRLLGAALAPLPLATAAAVVVVGLADSWRLALLVAAAAGAVAATRVRFSGRAALGLVLLVGLVALGGWGPSFDPRPVAAPSQHHRHGSDRAHGAQHDHHQHRHDHEERK